MKNKHVTKIKMFKMDKKVMLGVVAAVVVVVAAVFSFGFDGSLFKGQLTKVSRGRTPVTVQSKIKQDSRPKTAAEVKAAEQEARLKEAEVKAAAKAKAEAEAKAAEVAAAKAKAEAEAKAAAAAQAEAQAEAAAQAAAAEAQAIASTTLTLTNDGVSHKVFVKPGDSFVQLAQFTFKTNSLPVTLTDFAFNDVVSGGAQETDIVNPKIYFTFGDSYEGMFSFSPEFTESLLSNLQIILASKQIPLKVTLFGDIGPEAEGFHEFTVNKDVVKAYVGPNSSPVNQFYPGTPSYSVVVGN
jgi:hypothetical protein